MKNLQHHFRYLAFAVLGLFVIILPGLALAQMAAPSDKTIYVPYFCPLVGDPAPNDNPLDAKPLGLATEGNALNPVVAFDFASPVDIYVAVEASSARNDLWILGPDGQFRQFSEDILAPWESGIYTLKKDLLGPNVSTTDLPDDTYYLYLVATPSGQSLLDNETTPYYLWESSITVLPPYLKINPPCLQMESTVGSTINRTVTITNPSGSNESYTISYIEAGGIGFSLSNNSCNNNVMQPGSSCSFDIAFTPSVAGNQTVYLSIGVEGFSGTASSATAGAPPPFISIPVVGVGKEADVSCDPTFTPSESQVFDYGAHSDSFTVTYPQSCNDSWTATTTDSWIHVTTGSSSQGSTVYYAVDQNDGTSQRVGTITVSGQSFTVTQDPKSGVTPGTCTYSISPSSKSFDAAGGTGTITLNTQAGCEWSASGSLFSTWLSVTSVRTGTGSATISYSVGENLSSSPRTGTVTVEDKTFTVTQSGTGCNYYLSPGSVTLGSNGGSGTFNISTSGSSCSQPSVIPSDSWIHVSSISKGASGYSVTYKVDTNNSGAELDGSITVNGTLQFGITEGASGTVTNCSYQFDPQSNLTVGISGVTSASFSVTTGAECKWTASPGASWITNVTPAAQQTGSGTVTYSVAANSGGARSSYISVGGQNFSVSQAGSTTPPPPTSISYTTLPINTVKWYSIQAKSSSGTAPANGRPANFYKVTVPSGGCAQTDQVQFWLSGMKANVNMLIADPAHQFTSFSGAFDTYNAKMQGYSIAIGPPYWYQFNGTTTTESDFVSGVGANYTGQTFYIMIVNEDEVSTSFRLEANCN